MRTTKTALRVRESTQLIGRRLSWTLLAVGVAFLLAACGTEEPAASQEPATKNVLVLTEKDFEAMQAPDTDEDIERCFGSPSITVERPAESSVLPPVPIDIRLVPLGQSTVNLDTLKIKMGVLNVTKRVLENLTVSPDGITGMIDTAKPGKYKFTIKLYDSMDRCGKAVLQFQVLKP